MQKFGIELRRVGNTNSLYKDVDNVLGKCDILPGQVSDIAKMQTVAHSLQKMLKSENHFSVCTVNKCCEVCNICISKERMDVYNSIHCMHWNEMLPEYRMMITAMILDDFRTVLTDN